MIDENLVMNEIKKLEKEVESMDRPTRQGFLRLIRLMKINLEHPVYFEVPEFLRRD